MDTKSRRALEVLEAISAEERITQRSLASKLGIAVGLSNLYLKRLANKGYVKFVNVRPNRISYLLTPRGVAEKTRLTYEYLGHSLRVYAQVRAHLSNALRPHVHNGTRRVAICGVGEAAELAYLSLKEVGLEPVAFLDHGARDTFLGVTVLSIATHAQIPFDLLIVATLDRPDALRKELQAAGVPPKKMINLRPDTIRYRGTGRSAVTRS